MKFPTISRALSYAHLLGIHVKKKVDSAKAAIPLIRKKQPMPAIRPARPPKVAHAPIDKPKAQTMPIATLSSAEMAAIIADENKRCKEIVQFGMQYNCLSLACAIAFESDTSVSDAITTMENVRQVAALNNGGSRRLY